MKSMTRRSLAVVLAILMVFSTMMVGMVTANAASTVYLVNSKSWATPYAYSWTAGGEMSWPGSAMTVVDSANKVYSISTNYTKIIFSNNGSDQTANLDVQNGKYYEPKTGKWYDTKDEAIAASGSAVAYDWYVCGTLGGNNWTPAQANMGMTKQADGSYVKVIENVAKGNYEYKVNNGTWDKAYPSSNKTVSVATDGSTVTVTLKGTTVTDKVDAPAVPSSTAASTAAARATCPS